MSSNNLDTSISDDFAFSLYSKVTVCTQSAIKVEIIAELGKPC